MINKISGIYAIVNNVTGKMYVGSTQDFERRKRLHLSQLRNGTHHSYKLQEAYNQYGEENFAFSVLENVKDVNVLIDIEQSYIDKLNSCANGYNVSYSANNPVYDYRSRKLHNFVQFCGCDFTSISPQSIARLFYLATHLSYDKNTLYVTQRTKMCKRDMQRVMGLDKSVFNEFFAEMVKCEILFGDKHELRINPDVFTRGKSNKGNGVLVYIDPMRELYKNAGNFSHQYIGHVLRLVNSIDKMNNYMLSKDGSPLSIKSFFELSGYNLTNSSRVEKQYEKLSFVVDGKAQQLCLFERGLKRSDTRVVVNPNLIQMARCGKADRHLK